MAAKFVGAGEISVNRSRELLVEYDQHRLPIDLDALGGVGKVVLRRWAPEMNQVSSSPWLQRWHARSSEDQSKALRLQSFAMLGNPFSKRFAGDAAGREAKESLLGL